MKKVLSLILIMILALIVLTGCVDVNYEVTLNKDGTADIAYIYGFEKASLEQLGTNKLTNFLGIEKSIETKTREDIYKIVIAVEEMAKTKTGALIVIQRDISLSDITSTGVAMNSEISPQLLVNIFVPKTPLHDGAIVIRNNKISAAACILPLASGKDISRELGTRHRAAVGVSKEYDAIAIVVSEESGKVSIAKDGTLIADVSEEALKKILIKNIITNRLENKEKNKTNRLKRLREIKKKNKENESNISTDDKQKVTNEDKEN